LRGQEINLYQELCGEIGWVKDYFNSGVMLVSQRHKEVFKYRGEILRRSRLFVDQTMLNFRVQKGRFKTFDMGPRFNHFAGLNRSQRLMVTRFESHIIHYAGFEEFYGRGSLLPQMRKDIHYLDPQSIHPRSN